VHELVFLTMPQAALAALRLTRPLRQGTPGLGDVFGQRRNILANQNSCDEKNEHRLHH